MGKKPQKVDTGSFLGAMNVITMVIVVILLVAFAMMLGDAFATMLVLILLVAGGGFAGIYFSNKK